MVYLGFNLFLYGDEFQNSPKKNAGRIQNSKQTNEIETQAKFVAEFQ